MIGQITIEHGLVLNNPTLEIEQITYRQKTNEVLVECLFNEENSIYKHSRTYTFNATPNMLKADVLELMKNHELLKQFV